MHAPSALKLPKTPTRFPEDPIFLDLQASKKLTEKLADVVVEDIAAQKNKDVSTAPPATVGDAIVRAATFLGNEYAAKDRSMKAAAIIVNDLAQGKAETVDMIDGFLMQSNQTLDHIRAEALVDSIDQFERMDRMIAMAETRRNLILNELDMRRTGRAKRRRRMVGVDD